MATAKNIEDSRTEAPEIVVFGRQLSSFGLGPGHDYTADAARGGPDRKNVTERRT